MTLATEPYVDQIARWPREGRHILAHHDEETIVVYQAYRPSIGVYAINQGVFGGDFSYSRMSWIKPNFLWMMYRSGWGTKQGRRLFSASGCAASSLTAFWLARFLQASRQRISPVVTNGRRLWRNPMSGCNGTPTTIHMAGLFRAIVLGLRGAALEAFGRQEMLEVIDMTEFVARQRELLRHTGLADLRTPAERTYVPGAPALARRLKLD